MPPKTMLRAGAVALLVGVFLFWSIPVWLDSAELPSDRDLGLVLFWLCVSLIGLGGLCLLRAALTFLSQQSPSDRKLDLFSGMVPRNVLPSARHRPMPLITQLPNFGLIYGAILWILIFIFMIVEEPHHYYGLSIDFRTHDSVVWEKSPWQETLGVYLAVGEKYYINGQQVPRDALRTRLQQELNKRMLWTVYFEADYDTLNMDAIYAMDAIQGLGAKLVWITPKVREELRQSGQSAPHQSRNSPSGNTPKWQEVDQLCGILVFATPKKRIIIVNGKTETRLYVNTVKDAEVTLYRGTALDKACFDSTTPAGQTQSNNFGRFDFSGFQSGWYWLRIKKDDFGATIPIHTTKDFDAKSCGDRWVGRIFTVDAQPPKVETRIC